MSNKYCTEAYNKDSAGFNFPGGFTIPSELATVKIPKTDHDELLRLAQEYAALRNALLCGGITNDALEILIKGEGYDPQPTDHPDDTNAASSGPIFNNQPHAPIGVTEPSVDQSKSYVASNRHWTGTVGNGPARDTHHKFDRKLSSNPDENSFFSDPAVLDDIQLQSPNIVKPRYNRSEQRTITIKNLSDRATHRDITDIIRGGLLLDVYLRPYEKTASVSFVEGTAAVGFINYVKRNDVYMHGKRLEFAWSDRQFILPGHVAGKINTGATRNLVLRGVNPSITADRVREDLDHIHNLVVIEISFEKGDAFISLNSIHNSLFARTCMMSRATYKGMRIDWYPDECAQPLPKTPIIPKKAMKPVAAKNPPTMLNRFEMLNMDGSVNDSSTEEDDTLSEISAIHNRMDWAAEDIAV